MVAGVSDTLTHYFKENTTTDVEEAMIWEGHKAVVRGDGELISQGARCKRVRQADFQWVLGALQQTELRHKHQPEVLERLLELRDLFLVFTGL